MTPQLKRLIKPLITPAAAIRMTSQHLSGVATTNSTLGMLWWASYWQVWTDVMFPTGRNK